MRRALELARGVLGTTSPNPSVGCVIVKDGVVVGEGATQPPGGPHAEKVALAAAGERARGAAMYVTLEPCRHFGRTPPCTDAIIAAGVSEVYFSVIDPNPLVGGGGRRQLESAGIQVHQGDGEREASRLNEGFFKWVTRGLPFLTVKFAASLDGRTATSSGESRWITGEASRAEVHRLRAAADAIMVGANTALRDDPQLTARGTGAAGRQPLRVVVDSAARLPVTARMLKEPGATLLAVNETAPTARCEGLRLAGAEVAVLPQAGGMVDLSALMKLLASRGVVNVLVEGGGRLTGSLLAAGLADKVLAFIAPAIMGGLNAPTPVEGWDVTRMDQVLRLRDVSVARFGEDVLVTGYTGA
jgi:diaminohydroxyphosphoribosylaminopyrimidine deaminase/5-amino-6-(5-phosphoribosylamino)uracil reductase